MKPISQAAAPLVANARRRWTAIQLNVPVLTDEEKGRGANLSKDRTEELSAECYRLLKEGFKQREIAAALGASRSRVSRWSNAAVHKHSYARDTTMLKTRSLDMPQMLWARTEVTSTCWIWRGVIKNSGYGALNFKGKCVLAHRAWFELLVGPVPDGFVIDHICENRRCVNPLHLRPVRPSENLYCRKAERALI